jgi:hypothetical protein
MNRCDSSAAAWTTSSFHKLDDHIVSVQRRGVSGDSDWYFNRGNGPHCETSLKPGSPCDAILPNTTYSCETGSIARYAIQGISHLPSPATQFRHRV